MTDPVVADDGHLYERGAITAWLEAAAGKGGRVATSPVTKEAIRDHRLVPIVPLRAAIAEWVEQQQQQRREGRAQSGLAHAG
jgi:hypothetical protein